MLLTGSRGDTVNLPGRTGSKGDAGVTGFAGIYVYVVQNSSSLDNKSYTHWGMNDIQDAYSYW